MTVKAEAFNKHVWNVPLQNGRTGEKHTQEVRASWDPDKVSPDEIARVAEIEATRERGEAHVRVGPVELVVA